MVCGTYYVKYPSFMSESGSHRSSDVEDLGLPDSLVQLSFAVLGVLERVAKRYDASLPQVRLLGILRDRTLGMLELARLLDLDKSSMTGLVTRAELRSLVRRTTTPEDRRVVRVLITETGRELARRFAKEAEAEIIALLQEVTEVERTRLSRVATRIVMNDLGRRFDGGGPDLVPAVNAGRTRTTPEMRRAPNKRRAEPRSR
jgi:DNA-binding MarR family transcriptional regulator